MIPGAGLGLDEDHLLQALAVRSSGNRGLLTQAIWAATGRRGLGASRVSCLTLGNEQELDGHRARHHLGEGAVCIVIVGGE